jgi:UBX domain-containing protein 1/4
LLAHENDPKIDDPLEPATGVLTLGREQNDEETEAPVDPEAKSLQCTDCGKLLRTHDAAQFHATKTGHVNFAESTSELKPLTGMCLLSWWIR